MFNARAVLVLDFHTDYYPELEIRFFDDIPPVVDGPCIIEPHQASFFLSASVLAVANEDLKSISSRIFHDSLVAWQAPLIKLEADDKMVAPYMLRSCVLRAMTYLCR